MNKKVLDDLRKKSMVLYRYEDIDGDNNHGTRFDEELFAELIIKKCIDIASTPTGLNTEYKIRQYFGID